MTMNEKPNKNDVADLFLSVNLMESLNSLSTWYLSVVGGFYTAIGVTWVVTHSASREAGLIWINFLNSTTVGIIWVISGLLGIVSSCLKLNKLNRIAFFFMIMVPGVLGFYFLVSWFLYVTPFIKVDGRPNTIVSTMSYWTIAASSYAMARVYQITSIKNGSIGGF